jgi:cardiolipin synthase C
VIQAATLPQAAPAQGGEPGRATSSLTLLSDGVAAFAARAGSARAARASLDLQYYMWNADLSGELLAREALHAADRGVRVRMLLDDMHGLGQEFTLAPLIGHPMIELRRFNGTRWGRWGRLGMLLEMLVSNWHLNRRMHNKAWIADAELVICGGRNIGDSYFDASGDFNFRDLDVMLRGAPARTASAMFEAYWTNPLARPVRRLSLRPAARSLARLRRKLDASAASRAAEPYLERTRSPGRQQTRILEVEDDAIDVVSDLPEKARGLAGSAVAPAIGAMLAEARRDALLVSPYFVPGETGAARLIGLARAGVRVSVITNSLAATDVVAVHAGYARYRERLLAAGIELFEVKYSREKRAGVFGSSSASLHTKAVVIDDGQAFVGSFNLDPRSVNLNTEMGVVVRHQGMARLMRRQHRWLAQGTRSWRVRLEDGRLVWDDGITQHRGGGEPGASLLRRVLAGGLRWLPIESQL